MSSLEMKYFVLKPRSDSIDDAYAKASRLAMKAYAEEIKSTNLELSVDLLNWVNREHYRESELVVNKKYSNKTKGGE